MLEVVWSEGAAAGLAIAMTGSAGQSAGALGIIASHGDGHKPTKRELKAAQRRFFEQERKGWAQAVPLAGDRESVLCFPLRLQMGSIQGTVADAARTAALRQLLCAFPKEARNTAQHWVALAQKSLRRLLSDERKESVRIWVSDLPEDVCGLHWLMAQLPPEDLEQRPIHVVSLPRFVLTADGAVMQPGCWNEVTPYDLGRLAALQVTLPPALACAMADHWRLLQTEDAPLRAVISGRLVSVPETFYDSFILQELQKETGDFLEAEVIGRILDRYRFGIGDDWIALRIEQFIQAGLLLPVTWSAPGDPVYHRMLRWQAEKEGVCDA